MRRQESNKTTSYMTGFLSNLRRNEGKCHSMNKQEKNALCIYFVLLTDFFCWWKKMHRHLLKQKIYKISFFWRCKKLQMKKMHTWHLINKYMYVCSHSIFLKFVHNILLNNYYYVDTKCKYEEQEDRTQSTRPNSDMM